MKKLINKCTLSEMQNDHSVITNQIQELRKTLEELAKEYQVDSKDKARIGQDPEFLENLLDSQDPDKGFWTPCDSYDMPVDLRVEYVYEPTYMVSTILIILLLHDSSYSGNNKFLSSLRKGLLACTKREFEGHGYEGNAGFLNTCQIFLHADMDLFLERYHKLCSDFTALWRNVPTRLAEIRDAEENWFTTKSDKAGAIDLLNSFLVSPQEVLADFSLLKGEQYYIAYGSNMDEQQMAVRCRGARLLGPALVKDYNLSFRQSCSGFYASLDHKVGSQTPVLIWAVTKKHVKALDHYEGLGFVGAYYNTELYFHAPSCIKKGLIYLLPEDNLSGKPFDHYLDVMRKAYIKWGFERKHKFLCE